MLVYISSNWSIYGIITSIIGDNQDKVWTKGLENNLSQRIENVSQRKDKWIYSVFEFVFFSGKPKE